MEFVSGQIKIRDIFIDNGNWWRLAKRQPRNSPCPFQMPCHICHIGSMIPVNYHAQMENTTFFKTSSPLLKILTKIPSWNVFIIILTPSQLTPLTLLTIMNLNFEIP